MCIRDRLRTVNASLEDPTVWNDPKKAQELGKEKKLLDGVVLTLERLTRELEQQAIDREFAAMAEDSEYREIQRAVVQEFDASDWEAWEQGEKANS